jgi:hypothetical protein
VWIFDPLVISSSTTSLRPAEAALCNGVSPRSLCALTSAPFDINHYTISLLPAWDAWCRNVLFSAAFTSSFAPLSMRNLMTLNCPFLTKTICRPKNSRLYFRLVLLANE